MASKDGRARESGEAHRPGEAHKRPLGLDEMDVFAKNPTGAGITFGVSVVSFTLFGYLLDGWLGTLPLFLLVGLAIGGVGGFIHLVESVSPGTLFKSRKPPKSRNAGPSGIPDKNADKHAAKNAEKDPAKPEDGQA